ncbi:MAG: response regulator transcription factor [Janthinobacterium lividum]
MRVLVVEDETRLAENIAAGLREGPGYAVDVAADGEDALHMCSTNKYDLVVLDLMLPKMTGEDVVRTLRRLQNTTPVLMLTAVQSTERTIGLLDSGADDYMTKPFDLGELIARSRALIRRRNGASHSRLEFGHLQMHTGEQSVHYAGISIPLSPTEYRILELLMYRPRILVTKREMLESIYDFTWEHHSNVIEAHVSNLRKKLKQAADKDLLETARGRGYRLAQAELN